MADTAQHNSRHLEWELEASAIGLFGLVQCGSASSLRSYSHANLYEHGAELSENNRSADGRGKVIRRCM